MSWAGTLIGQIGVAALLLFARQKYESRIVKNTSLRERGGLIGSYEETWRISYRIPIDL